MFKKSLFIKLFLFLLIICGCSPRNSGDQISCYLDVENGNDADPGTIRKPIKTIEELERRLLEQPMSIYLRGKQTFF